MPPHPVLCSSSSLLHSFLFFSLHLECVLFICTLELMFLETSALTGENVEEGFLKCARTILNKIDSGTHFIVCFRLGVPVRLLTLVFGFIHGLEYMQPCGPSFNLVCLTFLVLFLFQRRVGPGEDGFRYPVWRCFVEAAATAQRHHHTE